MAEHFMWAKRLARLPLFLIRQRVIGFSPPTAAHFDPAALEEFQGQLQKSRLYLEFGSGGSTLEADRAGVPTVSVENDAYYARIIRDALEGVTKVNIVTVDIGLTGEWGRPVFTGLTPARVERWSRYSSAPWSVIPNGSFPDFILIDGRFRRACALQALRRAVAGGHETVIMFDDFYKPDSQYYRSVEQFLGSPRRVGRAAFFELNRDSNVRIPTDAQLREADADPR